MPPKGKGRGKAAAGHQLATALPKGEELKDLRKKSWFLGEPIGSGGFGLIYLADDDKKSIKSERAKYVVKVEPHGNGPLYCEVAFYQRAARQDLLTAWKKKARLSYVGIPAYIAHGLHQHDKENLRFMVMPRFGADLHKLWVKAQKRFQRRVVCQIAIELINALQYMHENEYVHADIKGANILLGHEDPNQIYLVDFGLAYRYTVEGKHKEYQEDPKKAHDGTIEYTSRDAHMGVAPSRRADMEILGYVLLHWLSGKLPWEDKLSNKNYVKEQKIRYMSNVKELVAKTCTDAETKKATEIKKYLENVSKLVYEEEPNYDFLRKLFQDALKSMNVQAKSKIIFESVEPDSPSPRKKKRVLAPKPKSSQSLDDSEEDETPKKKAKRAPIRRKKDTLEESSFASSSTSDMKSPVRATPVSKKKAVPAIKKSRARARKIKHVSTTDDSSASDENSPEMESPGSGARSHKYAAKKKPPPAKSLMSKSKDSQNSNGPSSEEINVMDSTVQGPHTRSSTGNAFNDGNEVVNSRTSASMAKSRYSMAPLHTKSVLGKEDTLSGKYSGKHPVIIRRRKAKRPRTDATTQTTPNLRKSSSRT